MFTMQEAILLLGKRRKTALTQRRIIHLCLRGIIKPLIDSKGTGSKRIFSNHNIEEIDICLDLIDAGFPYRITEKLLGEYMAGNRTTKVNRVTIHIS